ncbi:AMP1 protein, partial [Setophaga kirtlandii]|nr:AMP1 protein [Setophaga kirtlandii]
MKILFLVFPLILLLVQGTAGSALRCSLKHGFCIKHFCSRGTRIVGLCAPGYACCKR